MPQLIDLGKLRFYFAGEYNPATTYEINDVVKYGGNVYVYISVISAAGNLPTDTAYWSLMLKGINFEGPYVSGTSYQVGDGVAHGGKVYIAIANSVNITPPNVTYWSQFVDGIQYEGAYNGSTTYQKNDVVKYGGKAYIAKVDGAGNLPTNATYWDKLVDGISPSGVYNNGTAYVPGDVVAYGANTYTCILETTGNVPTNTTYWSAFSGGISYRGEWATSTQYYPNDVVNRGGRTYIALLSHVSSTFLTDLDNVKWQAFNGGIRVTGPFAPGTLYSIGDLAFDGISTYVANTEFTSGLTISADVANWELFAQGADYLPGQTGNEGKILSTDGTDPLWTYEVGKIQVRADEATFEDQGNLTDVIASFETTSSDFAQVVAINKGTGNGTSTDFIAYAPNGDNNTGWIDMGITSQSFTDPAFTITGPNDGYIFMSGADQKTATPASYTSNNNIVTMVTTAAHNLTVGTVVNIATPATVLNGQKTITGVPTATSFTYVTTITNTPTTTATSGIITTIQGNGNLVLATDGTGLQNKIIFAAGGLSSNNTQMSITPDVNVHIEIPTPSTSATTGALTVVGGVGLSGDIYALGTLNVEGVSYIGESARAEADNVGAITKTISNKALTSNVATITTSTAHGFGAFQDVVITGVDATFNGTYTIDSVPTPTTFTYSKTASNVTSTAASGTAESIPGFTNPMGIFVLDADDYAQVIAYNTNNSANSSSDFIAYPDNGTDYSGYIDMGITSSSFSDPEFTITGPNDGYIFMTAPLGSTGAGNLVLATGDTGTENKIVFAAGGLSSNNTQMSITPDLNVHIEIPTPSTSPVTGALTVVGGVGISGDMYVAGDVNIVGTITFGGAGTTVQTSNLAVEDPIIFLGSNNLTSVLDLGLVGEDNLPTTLDPQASVTTKALASNVATLGITLAGGSPQFKVGDSVVITNVDSTFNGTYTLTAASTTSISYAKTASNVSSTAALTAIPRTITTKEVFNAEAILTTSAAHTYAIGDSVVIANVDSTFNGTYTITAIPNTTTFKYALAVADVTSTAATSALTSTITNKELTSNSATLTTAAAHGYLVGESVIVTGVNATFNGTHTITSITSTTFSYALVDSDVASSAASGTSVVNRLIGTSSVSKLLGAANATDVLRPRYSGLVKDASDSIYKLFVGATTKPTTTVNFAEAGVTYAPLQVGSLNATTSVTASSMTITGSPTNATDAATVQYVKNSAASWVEQAANYTAVAGDMIWANTNSGVITITLPGSPAVNTIVRVGDLASKWGTNAPVLARNGNLIMGLAEDLTLDLNNAVVDLVYSGSTYGWRVF